MIFSSIFFLFLFLPVVLIVYYVLPWKAKNLWLLLASLFFYAWGEPIYVFLMLFSIVFNYLAGLEIEHFQEKGNKARLRFGFWLTVAANVAILGFFKYYGFLITNLNSFLHVNIPYRELSLPIGISFYTFQILSYIIDVYRGKVPAQTNIISLGTYVTMFPQLIAGPIVRYSDIAAQLKKRRLSLYKFGQGLTLFVIGLAKKALLANKIGLACDAILALPVGDRSVLAAWVGALAYTMQIYFDFSGYSDMAIGLGKMLGFDFAKNFDYPYISKSITEFWRRWHISLGTWFRDYVYIPLGGNRVCVARHICNILIVWALTGIWHGAAWNFILWGLYYGLLLVLEKYVLAPLLKRLPGIVREIYSFLLVLLGWVLFFTPTLGSAVSYLGNMFGIGGTGIWDSTGLYYLKSYAVLLVICIFCCRPVVRRLFRKVTNRDGVWPTAVAVGIYVLLFLLSVASLVNATYNPFLYFRF